MDIPEYKLALRSHDWFFMMSDDPSEYRRGRSRNAKLQSLAGTSEEHRELWDVATAWRSETLSGSRNRFPVQITK